MNEEFITTAEAVEMHEARGFGPVGKFTIIYWCKQYGIGLKIGGRWKVDRQKLEKLLSGGTRERSPKTKI